MRIFARATGTRANAYNLLIAVVIAVIIVLAMNLVGSLSDFSTCNFSGVVSNAVV